jgi:hypothetical protein
MKKWIFAGALALAIAGPVLVDGSVAKAAGVETQKLTEVNIGRIKNLLKLTASQEPLWARVEAVLHAIAREQAQAGVLSRISRQVISIAFNDGVGQRIKSAAMPLLASLDDEQQATARRLAQQMGIGDTVAMSTTTMSTLNMSH